MQRSICFWRKRSVKQTKKKKHAEATAAKQFRSELAAAKQEEKNMYMHLTDFCAYLYWGWIAEADPGGPSQSISPCRIRAEYHQPEALPASTSFSLPLWNPTQFFFLVQRNATAPKRGGGWTRATKPTTKIGSDSRVEGTRSCFLS